jgi:predicted DNA-binding transcriptional regulator YafY
VSRIAQATVGERACVRPPDFDLAAYWKSSTTAYQERLPRYHATLRVGPKTMGWLKTWRKTWLVGAASAPDAGGWVVQAIQFDCEDEACFVTLGLGGDVDVLEPDSLRLRVLADAEAIVARQPQVTAR